MVNSVEATSRVAQFNQFYNDAWRTYGVYYNEAYLDLEAYAGRNWTAIEKQKLLKQNRMVLELNKIRRVINLYSGYERENRTATAVTPVENGDEATADLFNEVLYYTYSKGAADYIISEAFDHALKTGLSIVGVYMDYENDPINGDIKFYWKPYNAIMLDPYMTKRDLSDCDQAATREFISKEEVKALLPWVPESEIDILPTGIRDNKFQYLGTYRQYNSQYMARNLVTYDQYWRRITKEATFLLDKKTGSIREWEGSPDDTALLEEVLAENPQVELVKKKKRTVELSIIVGGVLLYEGPDPTGLDDFPFVPIIAYFEPLIDNFELKIQGLVRSIRDAQKQYNRRHSQIIDIMESVINTGYITKNGTVLDPKMLLQAGCARNIVLNDNADVNADIREISPPQVPPGYLQYQEIIDQNILEIPGGSDELLGLSSTGDSQVSGKLAEVRSSNGLKGNRGIFDNLEQSKLYLGRLVLRLIQLNYSPGKIERITGDTPPEEFFLKSFGEYDVIVKQDIKTATQAEAYYYQLLQLVQLGAPIPWSAILESAPIQGKRNLVQIVQGIEEQNQQQQQIEMQQLQTLNELEISKTNENNALAQERRARVLADIGLARERISEAEQNKAQALLDQARTLREIQDMDEKRLMDVIKLSAEMKMAEMKASEKTLKQDMAKAEQLK